MIEKQDQAKVLHDRASRGDILTAAERSEIEKWYASQDVAEVEQLGLNAVEKTLTTLQEQVDAALTQLMTVTKRIQEVAMENERLRNEISTLRQQLVHLLSPQST